MLTMPRHRQPVVVSALSSPGGQLVEVSRSVHPGDDFRYELKVELAKP